MIFEINGALHSPTSNSFTPSPGDRASGILIIDDDLGIRSLLSMLLQNEGYFILQAGGADEAGAIWSQYRAFIDVVLCDFNLPDGEGPGIVAPFQQERPNLKVIFMSGMVPGTAPRFDGVQAHSFLEKPFNPRCLSASIRSALNERHDPIGK